MIIYATTDPRNQEVRSPFSLLLKLTKKRAGKGENRKRNTNCDWDWAWVQVQLECCERQLVTAAATKNNKNDCCNKQPEKGQHEIGFVHRTWNWTKVKWSEAKRSVQPGMNDQMNEVKWMNEWMNKATVKEPKGNTPCRATIAHTLVIFSLLTKLHLVKLYLQ